MDVTIRLFASLREKAGTPNINISVPVGTNVQQLLSLVQVEKLELEGAINGVLVAINHEYASADTIINESDDLALIPPVSGGAR
jgi:molybdopterin converting factor subunit 1